MAEPVEPRIAERVIREQADAFAEPLEVDPAPDRARGFTHTGFSRMRTRWNTEEQSVISLAHDQVEHELAVAFGDIYRILNRVYDTVRQYMRDPHTGAPITSGPHDMPVWEKDATGMEIEDWSRLTEAMKEEFLYQITTRLVLWEQAAAEMKGEALYSKALWEERYAAGFMGTPLIEGRRPTVEDRTQEGHASARDFRYMAIYMTVRSNRADALVRSMERLAQRMKDTLG